MLYNIRNDIHNKNEIIHKDNKLNKLYTILQVYFFRFA